MAASLAIPTATDGRVLIIGATGFIGKFVAEACLATPHPTYLLLRPQTFTPSKAAIIKTFQEKGAITIHGVINNKNLIEKILREYEIDIVISTVGGESLLDQLSLVEAIKTVNTIKRFLPSEFEHDVDRADPVEPGLTMYKNKRLIRRMIEECGVPFTNICCNSIASWPYYDNCHPSQLPPLIYQLEIYVNGNVKAYFVDGIDIGKFTMKVVDDVRTVNKNVHFRPSNNCYSINELAYLWENKIGRTIPRVTISEDDLLALAAENCLKGCQVNIKLDGLHDVEISALYPDEPFRCLEDCFEDFVLMIKDNIHKWENQINGIESVVEAVSITASC
ncbi:leucoanthocyanidin reductase-like [Abrus precatorius]|uniref:Leucoanthocyanidin reductase-like n=1 Tax=Abrus precatorius TaxID=3816 RepID=A0A8B8MGM8_ABRPR|nr:leucoanthocyanidin reductase-like [Abrus precatorius]